LTVVWVVLACSVGLGALLAVIYVAGFFSFWGLPALIQFVRSYPETHREEIEQNRRRLAEIRARNAERIREMKTAREARIQAIKAKYQRPTPKP